MEIKLTKLRGGVTLVKPEERKAIEDMYENAISQWRKRRRMFKDVWDTITENSPKDLKEFKVLISRPFIQRFKLSSSTLINLFNVSRKNSV